MLKRENRTNTQTNDPATGATVVEDVEYCCPDCDYDVRGIESDHCPECGGPIDLKALRRTQIPWSNRWQIGWISAFWRTFFQVTFQTPRFARHIARPVYLDDAKRFRLVVVWLVFAACLATLAMVVIAGEFVDRRDVWGVLDDFGWSWPYLGALLMLAVFWVYLYFATGLQTYWFHPGWISLSRQNRAVALAYYACAPLVVLVIVPIALGGVLIVSTFVDLDRMSSFLTLVVFLVYLLGTFGMVIVAALGYLFACNRLAARATGRAGRAAVSMMLWLPLCWVAVGTLLLVVFPATVIYLWVMLDSLSRL